MGLTKYGKLALIKGLASAVKCADILCSNNIHIPSCSLLCLPQLKDDAVYIIVDVAADKCSAAGVVDSKTKFQSYTLSDGNDIIWEGTLNNLTKPANAGMLLKIQLTLGDL